MRITEILGVLGFILALVQTIIKTREHFIRIKVFLLFVEWVDQYKVLIVNSSERPFEIIDLYVTLKNHPNIVGPIPRDACFENIIELPMVIDVGRSFSSSFSSHLNDPELVDKYKLKIFAVDSEGHIYRSRKKFSFNVRYGGFGITSRK